VIKLSGYVELVLQVELLVSKSKKFATKNFDLTAEDFRSRHNQRLYTNFYIFTHFEMTSEVGVWAMPW
jgi:hypothetical protein